MALSNRALILDYAATLTEMTQVFQDMLDEDDGFIDTPTGQSLYAAMHAVKEAEYRMQTTRLTAATEAMALRAAMATE